MKSGFKATVFVPVLLLVIFALILASGLIPAETLGLTENPYLAAVVIQLLIFAVPSLFWCRIRGKEFTPKLRLNPFPPSQLLYLWHAFVFMTSVALLISMLMYRLYPDSFAASSMTEYASFAMNDRVFDGLYLVVAFAVLPAVTEEFLFRGIVIGEYESQSAAIAVMASAALFAMSHFSWARFPVYFAAGIVLGMILYTTRSVLAPMLVHTVYNAVVLLGEKYILYITDKQNISMLLLVLILCAAALLSGMLACFEAQNIYRGYAEANVPSAYQRDADGRSAFAHIAEVFFSPTFLVLTLVFIVAATAMR